MAQTIRNSIATAALAAVAILWGQSAAPQDKKVRDQGELEIYNQTIQNAGDPAKQIRDLDTWTERYPDSDYRDERIYLYLQAYSKLTPAQPLKVIDHGRQLIARGLSTAFPGPPGMLNALNVLYLVSWNVAALPEATPDLLAAGEKAARDLLELAPKYFTPENRPASSTEEAWKTAQADLEKRARTALLAIAMAPGKLAMAREPKDCAAAEAAFRKTLAEHPDQAAVSYNLGTAMSCLARNEPAKAGTLAPRAIYHFVRAAVLDPTLGGSADGAKVAGYADTAYVQYHGSEDGLASLKEQVKGAPVPPEDFTIETASAVADRKAAEFAEKNPQIALWMRLRAQLAAVNGQQYFAGQLKDLAVSGAAGARALKGTLVEGRPACRSRDLMVEVVPGQVEIALRLDAPLSGRPVTGQTIEWDGVPKVFTQQPFMLTMETERARIEGLRVEACGGR